MATSSVEILLTTSEDTMAAYAIFLNNQTLDQAGLARYGKMAAPTLENRPVTPIAFFGAHETLEGVPVEGVVILSFPTMAEARAWYDSAEYAAARSERQASAQFQVILVEGLN